MKAECKRLLRAAGIDLGHSYTDDTCQWESDQCHIGFNQAPVLPNHAPKRRYACGNGYQYDSEWQSALTVRTRQSFKQ